MNGLQKGLVTADNRFTRKKAGHTIFSSQTGIFLDKDYKFDFLEQQLVLADGKTSRPFFYIIRNTE